MVEMKWMVTQKVDWLANEKLKDSWKVVIRAGLMADYWVVLMADLRAGQKAF